MLVVDQDAPEHHSPCRSDPAVVMVHILGPVDIDSAPHGSARGVDWRYCLS